MAKRKPVGKNPASLEVLARASASLDEAQTRIDEARNMIAELTETLSREDAEDLAAIAYVKGLIASGVEEVIPGHIVKRLDAGENPVRVFREFRGMTQGELAAKVDVTQGFISRIEGGAKLPSGGKFARLAKALNIDADLLLPDA